MNTHLIQYILERAQENKATIRFMDRKGTYTEHRYPDIWKKIKSYAMFFKSKGINEGDVVSLMLPTSIEYVYAFFAAQLIKATPISLYPPTSLADLDKWSLRTKEMLSSVQSFNLVTDLHTSSICDPLTKNENIRAFTVEDINLYKKEFSFDIETFNENQMCFLQFSSGTTGTPKAVVISQQNVMTNANIILDSLPMKREEISVVSWVPLFHDMGLVGNLIASIMNGTDITLIRPDDFLRKPILWLKALSDFKATCTAAPNFAYGLVQKRIPKEKLSEIDLSNLKASLCGAEMVYEETLNKFIDHLEPCGLERKSILPVYGMAEATLAVSFSRRESGPYFISVNSKELREGNIVLDDEGISLCSVGYILESFSLKIVDSSNEIVPDKKVGKILIKGPSITQGYFKNEKETQSLFIDSWLNTGDEGFIFKGQLFLCGRAKDTIIIRGKNYYPTSLEEKILKVPGIRKGRVIVSSSYSEKNDTEEIVVLAEAASMNTRERESSRIKEEINTIIRGESLPLKCIDILPPGVLLKTSSGKLKRRETLRVWEENKLIQGQAQAFLKRSLFIFTFYTKYIKNKLKAKVS